MAAKKGRMISKRVKVLDCNCSYKGKQGDVDRFDYCECKVRVEKGSRGATVSPKPDTSYIIPTVFVGAYPARAHGRKPQVG